MRRGVLASAAHPRTPVDLVWCGVACSLSCMCVCVCAVLYRAIVGHTRCHQRFRRQQRTECDKINNPFGIFLLDSYKLHLTQRLGRAQLKCPITSAVVDVVVICYVLSKDRLRVFVGEEMAPETWVIDIFL